MIININDNRQKAKAYSESKTFTFIQEKLPSGKSYYYNGFILEVKEDMVIFFDVTILREFPVLLDKIEVIEPSKRNDLTTQDALRILNEKGLSKDEIP